MRPEHFNRSARHWRKNIIKTGAVNSAPFDRGQGEAVASNTPKPTDRAKHTPMTTQPTTELTPAEQAITAAVVLYTLFWVWMCWMNFSFIYDYTIGSRLQPLIMLQEVTITLFLFGGLHLVWFARGREQLLAILPFIVSVLIIVDRAGLAAIYTKGIMQ